MPRFLFDQLRSPFEIPVRRLIILVRHDSEKWRGPIMELPAQVQSLIDAVSALPGVVGCFARPRGLEQFKPEHLSLPGEFGDLPQAIIRRTNGGRQNEVMLQTEVILDRSDAAWLTIEFLAWWVRDWGRSGRDIQMRPMALPPKAHEIQLGRTLKFFIEYFVIEPEDSFMWVPETLRP